MVAKSLIEAVQQITGKENVSEKDAMLFAKNNYIELFMFHMYENKIINYSKKLNRNKESRIIELKRKYSKN